MPKRILFTGKQELTVEHFASQAAIGPTDVRIAGLRSLISTGTEGIVFNRLFDPDTSWDRWVKYPFEPGYSLVGQVIEVGSEVEGLAVGQRVVTRKGHATEQVVPANDCLIAPDDIPLDQAAWFALAKIAYCGAKAGAYPLGARVLIIGGGPIGQLSARWARIAGARTVVLIDPVASRLELAKRGGIHATVGMPIGDEAFEPIKEALDGQLPDVVVDTTGAASVFPQALRAAASGGRVVLLGDTGSPTKQHLTADLLNRGLTVVGAHDMHLPDAPGVALFWRVLADGRMNLDGMVTDRFSIDQASQAYDAINQRRDQTMGIVFNLDTDVDVTTSNASGSCA